MTEQFEQAKREFVEKWNLKYSKEPTTDPHTECLYYPITPHKSECLSDLTSLLEQHKEVMMGFIRWLFWCDYRMTEEGLHSTYESTPNGTLIELYEWWLKNMKK